MTGKRSVLASICDRLSMSAFLQSVRTPSTKTHKAMWLFFLSTTKQLHELETERKKVVQQLKEKDGKYQGTVLESWFTAFLINVFPNRES